MANVELNPDSMMLRQSDGMWQRYLCLVMWKLKKRERVVITEQDIIEFHNEAERNGIVILTQGHLTSLTFQLVTNKEGIQIANDEAAKDRTSQLS